MLVNLYLFFLFQTPMHIAAKTGNSDVIGALLRTEKVDLTLIDLGGIHLLNLKHQSHLQKAMEITLFYVNMV